MNTQLIRLMRARSMAQATAMMPSVVASPARGGGGHWHKPDPKPYKPYKWTRRPRLEDVNTDLYNSVGPEYYLHMHSPHIQSSKQGLLLWLSYFFLILLPGWLVARWLCKSSTANCFPSVRGVSDHAHMMPKLLYHLKNNDYERMDDRFGRMPATFYKNWVRQELAGEKKTATVLQMEKHL